MVHLKTPKPEDCMIKKIFGSSDFLAGAGLFSPTAAEKERPQAERNPNLAMAAMRARAGLAEIFADRLPSFEREMLAFLLRKAAELPAEQKIDAIEKRFGTLKGDARVRAEEQFAPPLTHSKSLTSPDSVSN